jgi:hypothetical protein
VILYISSQLLLASTVERVLSFDTLSIPPEDDVLGVPLVLDYYNGDAGYLRSGYQSWNIAFDSNALVIGSDAVGGPGTFNEAKDGGYAVGAIETAFFEMTTATKIVSFSFWYKSVFGSAASYGLYAGNSLISTINLQTSVSQDIDAFTTWTQETVSSSTLSANSITKVRFSADLNSSVFDKFVITLQ